MTDENELFNAYRQTHFCADTPLGRIVIQVDRTNSTLDTLLRGTGHATWAYITAFNPGSVPLSEAENEVRQQDLEDVVRRLGNPTYRGEGIGTDRSWPSERSILVLGIERQAAMGLGVRFGQRAIVWGELAGPAVLVSCKE